MAGKRQQATVSSEQCLLLGGAATRSADIDDGEVAVSVSSVKFRTVGGTMSERSLRRPVIGSVVAAARAVLALAVVAVMATLTATPASAVAVVVPEIDIQLQGTVVQAPPADGISQLDEMSYQLTFRNLGPDPLPARSLSIVVRVDNASAPNASTIEVTRLSGPTEPEPGGECGTGRRPVTRCTNSQELAVGGEFQMVVGHLHPAAEAGTLSFIGEVTPREGAYADPASGNNFFRGPTYSFVNPPEETTTTTSVEEPTETTVVEPTTSVPEETSSSVETETTTSIEATTTTLAATTTAPTTTVATTATTLPTTVATAPTTSIEQLADTDAEVVGENAAAVLGATGVAEEDPDTAAAPLAPSTSDGGGGPPLLLIGGFLAVLVLLGGVGTALYAYYNRPPPLVDIRQYR